MALALLSHYPVGVSFPGGGESHESGARCLVGKTDKTDKTYAACGEACMG